MILHQNTTTKVSLIKCIVMPWQPVELNRHKFLDNKISPRQRQNCVWRNSTLRKVFHSQSHLANQFIFSTGKLTKCLAENPQKLQRFHYQDHRWVDLKRHSIINHPLKSKIYHCSRVAQVEGNGNRDSCLPAQMWSITIGLKWVCPLQ